VASKIEPVGPSQNYQRFALGTLALAGMVALFSTDHAEPAAGATIAQAPATDLAPPKPRLSRASFNPLPPVAMAEAESDDGAGSPESGNAEGEIAPSPTLATEPVLTAAEAKGPGAGPSSAAEAGQLMASSRNRSGGVDQGDDPIRAPAR
jgi:hypothetical protein